MRKNAMEPQMDTDAHRSRIRLRRSARSLTDISRLRSHLGKELPHGLLQRGCADDAVAAVNGGLAFEIEEAGAGLFGNDLERREVPGLAAGFDPDFGLAARNHQGVQTSTHAAHGPEGLHPSKQLGAERLARGGVQAVE